MRSSRSAGARAKGAKTPTGRNRRSFSMSIKFNLGRVLAGAAVLALFAPAAALAGDRLGTLQCKLLGNGISVIVENQQIDCYYRDDAEGAFPAHYTGVLTKVGPEHHGKRSGRTGLGRRCSDKSGRSRRAGRQLRRTWRLREIRRRRWRRDSRRRLEQHFFASAVQRSGRIGSGLERRRRKPEARLCSAASAAAPAGASQASPSSSLMMSSREASPRASHAGGRKSINRSVGKS